MSKWCRKRKDGETDMEKRIEGAAGAWKVYHGISDTSDSLE